MIRTKSTILLATLLSASLLGGCARFVQDVKEGNTRQVVVVDKTRPITNITGIDIDMSKLHVDKTAERAQKRKLRHTMIADLKGNNLYQNGEGKGDTVEVTVNRVDDSLVSKRMQIRTQVYDHNGKLINSTIIYTAGKGLQRLGFKHEDFSLGTLRDEYADNLAHYLKKPPRYHMHQSSS